MTVITPPSAPFPSSRPSPPARPSQPPSGTDPLPTLRSGHEPVPGIPDDDDGQIVGPGSRARTGPVAAFAVELALIAVAVSASIGVARLIQGGLGHAVLVPLFVTVLAGGAVTALASREGSPGARGGGTRSHCDRSRTDLDGRARGHPVRFSDDHDGPRGFERDTPRKGRDGIEPDPGARCRRSGPDRVVRCRTRVRRGACPLRDVQTPLAHLATTPRTPTHLRDVLLFGAFERAHRPPTDPRSCTSLQHCSS